MTLPKELLDELDRVLEAQRYASRSEAIRDAVRDFLASYKWRQELRGELIGVVVLVYDHNVRGLTDTLLDIQHSNPAISTVQHVHLDARNCLETLLVRGSAKEIKKLIDRLGGLRGVKQAKLVTIER